jgi:putative hydrolase of the HAD superfamily
MPPKAVIFDLGGVLIERAFPPFSKHFGPHHGITAAKVSASLRRHWDPFCLGQISENEYWRRFSADLGIQNHPKKYGRLLRECFVLNNEVFEVAVQLRGQCALAILSNISKEWLDYLLKKYPLQKTFRYVFASAELGLAKPRTKSERDTKEMYLHAAEVMRLRPEDCVFVDDHEENLVPAAQIGMRPFLFRSIKELKGFLAGLGFLVE